MCVCFHPSLIELQRAGSVCVMKCALVICFHTLWPAACPLTAPSPQCERGWGAARTRSCARTSHTQDTQLACMQQTPAWSKRAPLWVPVIKHADTTEHQHVNNLTRFKLLDQSQRQRCVVFISQCQNKWKCCCTEPNFAESLDQGQKNLRLEQKIFQSPAEGGRRCVSLWTTSSQAL